MICRPGWPLPTILRSILIVQLKSPDVCLCVGAPACLMYKCLQRLKDGIRSSAAGALGHCEPPDLGAAK